MSTILSYFRIFLRREILAKMTVKKRVIFSLNYIFTIGWELNGDLSLSLFLLSPIFNDFDEFENLAKIKPKRKLPDIRHSKNEVLDERSERHELLCDNKVQNYYFWYKA